MVCEEVILIANVQLTSENSDSDEVGPEFIHFI